ncbi:hypothetical protein CP03DC29_0243B, partial [Chlamydia psittaci 03DC29]
VLAFQDLGRIHSF